MDWLLLVTGVLLVSVAFVFGMWFESRRRTRKEQRETPLLVGDGAYRTPPRDRSLEGASEKKEEEEEEEATYLELLEKPQPVVPVGSKFLHWNHITEYWIITDTDYHTELVVRTKLGSYVQLERWQQKAWKGTKLEAREAAATLLTAGYQLTSEFESVALEHLV